MEQLERARIEDYGYKDHRRVQKAWKIIQTIILVITVIAMYASIFIILIQSVNKSTNANEWGGFTLSWYGKIFSNRALWSSIKNTFIISIAATAISIVLGTLIAAGIYAMSKKSQRVMLLLNNIPLLNADIVTGISMMLIFSFVVKLFPYFFGWKTLLIAHIYFTLPYTILSVLPKLKELDPNLFDASIDLGVKPYKTFAKVIVPAIKAGIFSGMILAFTMSFDDFVISYYSTGNGFDTLSIWIYSSIGRKSLTPSVYAFSTLFTLVSAACLIISNFIKSRGKKNDKNKRK